MDGEVLVTEITDPDWEPILKRAAGLVTERGGRTSHAAIVARELGIPAIVGAGDIGDRIVDHRHRHRVVCRGRVGRGLRGAVPFEIEEIDLATLPETETEIMLNVGDPSVGVQARAACRRRASDWPGWSSSSPATFGVHPLALTRYDTLDPVTRREVDEVHDRLRRAHRVPRRHASHSGIGTLAAAFWPRPVILRFSDFKTNEYAGLVGGDGFEPTEPNPMIGWRGAAATTTPTTERGSNSRSRQFVGSARSSGSPISR